MRRRVISKTLVALALALSACSQPSGPGDITVDGDGVTHIPEDLLNPAPADARFTPDMTWDSIQQLPGIWGKAWSSPVEFDALAVTLAQIPYPPLKPEYMEQSKARVQRIMDGEAEFYQASCKPFGLTRTIWYTSAPAFLFQPGNRLIMFQQEFREIWMDGRPHPAEIAADDNSAKFLGHSVGWWEGDTLVIDTVGIHPDHELYYGVKNQGEHVVERWRIDEQGRLAVTMTVDAPNVLAEPWVFEKYYTERDQLIATDLGGGTSGARSVMCDRDDARQKVDGSGDVQLDLTPPPPGVSG